MLLAPWRSPLARALHRNRSRAYSRYPQLATVRPNGHPANRTVVFREFLPETNCLIFVTDIRSEKIQHLAKNPVAELCWYFTETREQFRLSGEVKAIAPTATDAISQQIRHRAWESLSDKARQQFVWPHPGQARALESFEEVTLPADAPLDTFAVLLFDPENVDHLELRGNPQNRHQYWLQPDGTWQMLSVNP